MSLNKKLAAMRASGIKRFPPEQIEIEDRDLEELAASGILDSVIKVKERLPDFSLKNTDGITVHSTELLAKGPLVLSFFRGSW